MSWAIVCRQCGRAVLETFDRRTADAINRAAYDVLPISTYLGALNASIGAISMNDYLRGLSEALALARAKPTAFAFSVAAEIEALVDAEKKRLKPIQERSERNRRAIAPRAIPGVPLR